MRHGRGSATPSPARAARAAPRRRQSRPPSRSPATSGGGTGLQKHRAAAFASFFAASEGVTEEAAVRMTWNTWPGARRRRRTCLCRAGLCITGAGTIEAGTASALRRRLARGRSRPAAWLPHAQRVPATLPRLVRARRGGRRGRRQRVTFLCRCSPLGAAALPRGGRASVSAAARRSVRNAVRERTRPAPPNLPALGSGTAAATASCASRQSARRRGPRSPCSPRSRSPSRAAAHLARANPNPSSTSARCWGVWAALTSRWTIHRAGCGCPTSI